MAESQLQVFTDKWQYGTVPEVDERQEVDYAHLAAMGSCFARNLNRWLNFHEYTDRQMPWDTLYNPFSIQKELERLYQPSTTEQAAQNALHEVSGSGQERYRDPWRTWHAFPSREELTQANQEFDIRVSGFLKNSNGFLITLGLVEVWTPADDPDLVLNQVPIGSIRRGDRQWESRFASVGEVYDSLNKTVDTIRENVTEDGPVIFTLSPVPLKFTASTLDIREANNRSKATLAVALGELTTSRSDVEYFPSYEMVQAFAEQPDSKVWQADGRHVSAHTIDLVAQSFLATHGQPANTGNDAKFWVPRVDGNGQIIGKLYVDQTQE